MQEEAWGRLGAAESVVRQKDPLHPRHPSACSVAVEGGRLLVGPWMLHPWLLRLSSVALSSTQEEVHRGGPASSLPVALSALGWRIGKPGRMCAAGHEMKSPRTPYLPSKGSATLPKRNVTHGLTVHCDYHSYLFIYIYIA